MIALALALLVSAMSVSASLAPISVALVNGSATIPAVPDGSADAAFVPTSPSALNPLPPGSTASFSWRVSASAPAGFQYRFSASATFSLWSSAAPVGSMNETNSSVSSTLASSGTVPASPAAWSSTVHCGERFVGLNSLSIVVWSVNVSSGVITEVFDPISFAWRWQCAKPGCDAKCYEHGHCNVLAGECICNNSYVGTNCNVALTSPSLSNGQIVLCPQRSLDFTIVLPADVSPLSWYSLSDLGDNTVDWRYFVTGTSVPPPQDGAGVVLPMNVSLSVPLTLVPGTYEWYIYKTGGYDKLTTMEVIILDWSDPLCAVVPNGTCTNDSDCNSSSHGTCTAGKCKCLAGHFGPDCSRGCGIISDTLLQPLMLTTMQGGISNDIAGTRANTLYSIDSSCAWVISPPSSFDVIEIAFEWLALSDGDKIVFSKGRFGNGSQVATFDGTWAQPPKAMDIKTSSELFVSFTSDYANIGHGFKFSFHASTQPMPSGTKAAIAVPISFAGCFAALAIFVLVRHKRRKDARKRETEQNILAEVWPESEEAAEKQTEETALSSCATMQDKAGVEIAKTKLDFGLGTTEPCPVSKQIHDTLELTNLTGRHVTYRVLVPNGGYAFEMRINPGSGTILPHETKVLHIAFTLSYTTKVTRMVKIEVKNGNVTTNAYFGINMEGAISDKLDPTEITLDTQPLGAGSFGSVYKGMYRGGLIAVKVLKKQHVLNQDQLNEFNKEIELYRKLRGPFIVNYVGASSVPGRMCLCTELMEHGNLDAFMRDYDLPYALSIKFSWDIAEVMDFLHSQNVLYRDLKPANVLISSASLSAKVNCKLGDFGTSKNVERAFEVFQHTKGMGTPLYMAPELLSNLLYNNKVDQYSFGVTLWQLLAHEIPWSNCSCWEIPMKVINGERPDIPKDWPEDVATVIRACWSQDPKDRPEFADLSASLKEIFEVARAQHKKEGKKKAIRKSPASGGLSAPTATSTGMLSVLPPPLDTTTGDSYSAIVTTTGTGKGMTQTVFGGSTTQASGNATGQGTTGASSSAGAIECDDADIMHFAKGDLKQRGVALGKLHKAGKSPSPKPEDEVAAKPISETAASQ